MADPVWTQQYQLNQSPEGNGFTRTLYGSPVVNEVTGGTPANRRIEINSDNGSVVFVTSQVPSLDDLVGATIECIVQVTGTGNAGYELTFLNRYIGVQIYQNKITIALADGENPHEFATADNSGQVTIRLIYAANSMSIYRNGIIVATLSVPSTPKPFQRVLWWGEEGGVQIWRALRYYIGGAVAP